MKRRTPEQVKQIKKWILANYDNYENYFLLTEALKQQLNTDMTVANIKNYARYLGLKKTNRKFETEHIEWIKENAKKYSLEELTTAFNKKFNKKYEQNQIYNAITTNHIQRTNAVLWDKKPEYTEWLIDNGYKYKNYEDMKNAFNKEFDENTTISGISKQYNKLGLKTANFTKEETQWIIDNYYNFDSMKELTIAYNEHFKQHRQRTYAKIRQKCGRLKLYSKYHYTAEQDEWIRENICKYSRKELTQKFNERFGENRTESGMHTRCNKELGLHFLDYPERYKETMKKGYHNSEKYVPVGSERWDQGTLMLKIDDNLWVSKARYVNGIGKDKDKLAFIIDKNKPVTKENTIVVNKKINGLMMKYGFNSLNPQLKPLAFKICKLHTILKGE